MAGLMMKGGTPGGGGGIGGIAGGLADAIRRDPSMLQMAVSKTPARMALDENGIPLLGHVDRRPAGKVAPQPGPNTLGGAGKPALMRKILQMRYQNPEAITGGGGGGKTATTVGGEQVLPYYMRDGGAGR